MRAKICALSALILPAAAGAAIFNDYEPIVHDRFLSDASGNPDYSQRNPYFIAPSNDLTGIGVGSRGALLITPQHYITADHYTTSNPRFVGSDGVVRTPGRDTSFGSNGYQTLTTTYTNENGESVTQNSDVRIGKLANPLDTSLYMPMPIADATTEFLIDCEVLVFDQFDRAGINFVDDVLLTAFLDTAGNINRPTVVAGYDFDTTAEGGATSEVFLQVGDSSHALLLRTQGELFALGTHFAISYEDEEQTIPGSSFSSYLAPYLDQLTDVIDSDNLASGTDYELDITTFSVPEPTAMVLLAAPTLILRRRRHAS